VLRHEAQLEHPRLQVLVRFQARRWLRSGSNCASQHRSGTQARQPSQ
jgi:hypothetical protein